MRHSAQNLYPKSEKIKPYSICLERGNHERYASLLGDLYFYISRCFGGFNGKVGLDAQPLNPLWGIRGCNWQQFTVLRALVRTAIRWINLRGISMPRTLALKNRTLSILSAGLMVFGITGLLHAQGLGGPGQVGGMGQGGAPAGQFPTDLRNSPVGQRDTQRGAPGAQLPTDPRNTPIGQRDAQGGAVARQLPPDSRNTPIGQRDAQGGAMAGQFPSDSRSALTGQGSAQGVPMAGQFPSDGRKTSVGQKRAQGSSTSRQGTSGKQGASKNYYQGQKSGSTKRDSKTGSSSSQGSRASGTSSPGASPRTQ
jgi:hypothetical protein